MYIIWVTLRGYSIDTMCTHLKPLEPKLMEICKNFDFESGEVARSVPLLLGKSDGFIRLKTPDFDQS